MRVHYSLFSDAGTDEPGVRSAGHGRAVAPAAASPAEAAGTAAKKNQQRRSTSAPVVVRSMSTPRDGWTLANAVALARQGYQLDAIERRTGWAATQIQANLHLV